MFRNKGMVALFAVSIVAIWPTAASACTCRAGQTHKHTTIGGSIVCTCSNSSTQSVVSDIEQTGGWGGAPSGSLLGTLVVPQPNSAALPTPPDPDAGNALVLCANRGNKNLPGGIQVRFTGVTVGPFDAFEPAQKVTGNKYTVDDVLASALDPAGPNFDDYAALLNARCPSGLTAVGYVPCDMNLRVQRKEAGIVTVESEVPCTLDDPALPGNECFTLGYDATTKKFDSRQYICSGTP